MEGFRAPGEGAADRPRRHGAQHRRYGVVSDAVGGGFHALLAYAFVEGPQQPLATGAGVTAGVAFGAQHPDAAGTGSMAVAAAGAGQQPPA